jgi:hypothetical protein
VLELRRKAYRILLETSFEVSSPARPTTGRENNTKMDFREIVACFGAV